MKVRELKNGAPQAPVHYVNVRIHHDMTGHAPTLWFKSGAGWQVQSDVCFQLASKGLATYIGAWRAQAASP